MTDSILSTVQDAMIQAGDRIEAGGDALSIHTDLVRILSVAACALKTALSAHPNHPLYEGAMDRIADLIARSLIHIGRIRADIAASHGATLH